MALCLEDQDKFWMKRALELAHAGSLKGEVPVGAVLVRGDTALAEAHNDREGSENPLGHAELLCLQEASRKLNSWRLPGTTLYVTLEPCPMCAGALVQSRVSRLVFGALDPKTGAAQSLYQIPCDPRLPHRMDVTSGVLEQDCSAILKEFFKKLRL